MITGFRQLIKGVQEQGNNGKAFEVFCKWFLENDHYLKTQAETKWLWDKWPYKWGTPGVWVGLAKIEIKPFVQ